MTTKLSTELRLKKKQRGWYEDPNPTFHDYNAKLEEARKKNNEVKLAAHGDILRNSRTRKIDLLPAAAMTAIAPLAGTFLGVEDLMRKGPSGYVGGVKRVLSDLPAVARNDIAALPGAAGLTAGHLAPAALATYGLYRGGKALINHFSPSIPEEPSQEASTEQPKLAGHFDYLKNISDGYRTLRSGVLGVMSHPIEDFGRGIRSGATAISDGHYLRSFLDSPGGVARVAKQDAPRMLLQELPYATGKMLPGLAAAYTGYQLGKGAVKSVLNSDGEKNGQDEAGLKAQAVRDALDKFALLDNFKNPVDGLAHTLRTNNFGYDKKTKGGGGRPSGDFNSFGSPAGLGSGGAADRISSSNTGYNYGGV